MVTDQNRKLATREKERHGLLATFWLVTLVTLVTGFSVLAQQFEPSTRSSGQVERDLETKTVPWVGPKAHDFLHLIDRGCLVRVASSGLEVGGESMHGRYSFLVLDEACARGEAP